jgi:hypothetical protein
MVQFKFQTATVFKLSQSLPYFKIEENGPYISIAQRLEDSAESLKTAESRMLSEDVNGLRVL